MKLIFTAALAASLLGGTAVMAQPGDKNRDRGHSGEQADPQVDRKAQKTEDKADRRDNRAAPAGPSDRADSRPQGRGDRNTPDVRVSQPAPVPSAVPSQAVRDASPQGRGDRNAPGVRMSQPVPAPSAAPSQAMRDASPYAGRQAGRMPEAAPAPQYQAPQNQTRNASTRSGGDNRTQATRWSRGDRVPDQYRQQDRYHVNDWQQYGLRQPPGGYRWIRDDNNDFYLSLMSTGVITDTVYRSDRDDRWRQRYSRNYSYNDDVYYQQCRRSPDPAGVLLGGLIGGLLGNSAGRGDRTGATIAGVIVGGAVGAALTRNMDCDDRSYAYKTYYNGFNAGRPGNYQWRNPRNDNRGELRIGGYYNDPYGFRCARFNQVTYIQGRAYNGNGVACRQPDGNWAVVS